MPMRWENSQERDRYFQRMTQMVNLMKSGQDPYANLRWRAECLLSRGNSSEIALTQKERDTLERICIAPIEADRDWLGDTFDERLEALIDEDDD